MPGLGPAELFVSLVMLILYGTVIGAVIFALRLLLRLTRAVEDMAALMEDAVDAVRGSEGASAIDSVHTDEA